jgi:uncharacterized membrane protein YeaQ/YmgE (transglycosylase-associated protein family)
MLWTIIGAIILGTILGVLGRLVVPGEQAIPWWLTILVGIVAAFVGGWIYEAFGGGETSGIDWIKFLIQLVVAAVGVFVVAGLWSRRSSAM